MARQQLRIVHNGFYILCFRASPHIYFYCTLLNHIHSVSILTILDILLFRLLDYSSYYFNLVVLVRYDYLGQWLSMLGSTLLMTDWTRARVLMVIHDFKCLIVFEAKPVSSVILDYRYTTLLTGWFLNSLIRLGGIKVMIKLQDIRSLAMSWLGAPEKLKAKIRLLSIVYKIPLFIADGRILILFLATLHHF